MAIREVLQLERDRVLLILSELQGAPGACKDPHATKLRVTRDATRLCGLVWKRLLLSAGNYRSQSPKKPPPPQWA